MIITIDTEKDGVKEFRAALNLLRSLLNEKENPAENSSAGTISEEGASAFGSLFGSDDNSSSPQKETEEPHQEEKPDQILLEPY